MGGLDNLSTDDSTLSRDVRSAVVPANYSSVTGSATDMSESDDNDSDISGTSSTTTGKDELPSFSASLLRPCQPGFMISVTLSVFIK